MCSYFLMMNYQHKILTEHIILYIFYFYIFSNSVSFTGVFLVVIFHILGFQYTKIILNYCIDVSSNRLEVHCIGMFQWEVSCRLQENYILVLSCLVSTKLFMHQFIYLRSREDKLNQVQIYD